VIEGARSIGSWISRTSRGGRRYPGRRGEVGEDKEVGSD
jgi:hypothetical protein